MTVPPPNLRPLSVGEILDKAFRLYRANFWFFIGIVSILLVPLGILEVLSQIFFENTAVPSIAEGFLLFLLQGALIWAAARIYLGLPATMSEAYQAGRQRFGSLWGNSFLKGVSYIPAGFLIAIGAVAGTPGVVVTVIMAIPYVLLLSTRWGVDTAALMIEGLGARTALDRSWRLTAQDVWHVLGTILTSGLLVYLVASLPSLALNYAVTQYSILPDVGPIISIGISKLGTLLSTPLSIMATVILYYDLRVRREGYDLELALQAPQAEQAAG